MISMIELLNFKCFEHEHVPLRSFNLLSGLNGSGKSTLIQGLLLLRQSNAQGFLRSGRLALNGEFVQIGAGYDVFHESAEDEIMSLGVQWSDGACARWEFDYNRGAETLVGRSIKVTPDLFDRTPMGGDVQYLTAERTGPRVAYQMADYAVEHQRQLGIRGEMASHFLGHFGANNCIGSPFVRHSNAASESLSSHVEAWLGEISPGVQLHVEMLRDLDIVQLKYSFAGPAGKTRDYRPTNVGFGLSYTLSIIVAALAARPGALLIIENPEAHLHPKGQISLTKLLTNAAKGGVQVVVETHSDHVLNGLRLAVREDGLDPNDITIHFFERRATPERTYHTFISPRLDTKGRLEPWPTGFFDEMEHSLDRLV